MNRIRPESAELQWARQHRSSCFSSVVHSKLINLPTQNPAGLRALSHFDPESLELEIRLSGYAMNRVAGITARRRCRRRAARLFSGTKICKHHWSRLRDTSGTSEDFQGLWPSLVDVVSETIMSIFGIRGGVFEAMRENAAPETGRNVVSAVSDASNKDCALVCVSKSFEQMTG